MQNRIRRDEEKFILMIAGFSLLSLCSVLLAYRYQPRFAWGIVALQPYCSYFVFTKLHFHFIYQGGGVVFYPFGYFTLAMPLMSLSLMGYYLLKRFGSVGR